ncbi:MAG: phosphorylating glyceraldehyde-3-phosphate dehydrogenase [Sulfolobaceae archaeon]|nr:phosphorylating glyceraldehyde-3-phosphate dehydrogenase [Stygiolobus sp.]
MAKVKVAVNGYGTIGKRVADAVKLQPDMELIGVAKTSPNYEALTAVKKGYRIFTVKENIPKFEKNGIPVAGTVEDMVKEADIIVDATPNGVGATYKLLYQQFGKKALFQGGEKADVAEISFSALCNYDEAKNKNYIRVVSCNTTGILRILCTINNYINKIEKVRTTIVRRASDPKEVKKGPINAIVPDPATVPSHHAKDVLTVLKGIDIITMAVIAPTTLMHLHTMMITLKDKVTREDVIKVLSDTPRIVLVNGKSGVGSTAEIVEVARDLGRYRYDIPEVVVFEDSVFVNGNELYLMYGVHQESIVVPENIDAIRAAMNLANKEESIKITNDTLGIMKGYLI